MTASKQFYIVFLALSSLLMLGQEPQFTQFYATPLLLNPAFTGLTFEHRFSANYKNQWPGIKKAYSTAFASYDYNANSANSGIGVYFLYDRIGSSNLVTQQEGLNYAYRIKIDKFSELRLGLSAALTQKKLDLDRLIFTDQLESGGTSKDALEGGRVSYVDLGSGALYNSTNFWLGVSAKHLNKPKNSFVDRSATLPLFLSVHGGYRHIITARGAGKTRLEEYISASLHYKHELKYDQLDIGAYYFKDFINLGIWYRGLPFKRYKPGFPTRESLALLIGIETEKNLRIGYSFDFTLSKLGLNNTKGSHEVSLIYEIAKLNKRNRKNAVSVPKF